MSVDKQCQHLTLARSGIATISYCPDCGCVSVDMGPCTIRIEESGLEALWKTLGEATAAMHRAKLTQQQFCCPPGSA